MNKKINDFKAIAKEIGTAGGYVWGSELSSYDVEKNREIYGVKIPIPDEFYALAQVANGIRNDRAEIYAIYSDDPSNYFTSLIQANEQKGSPERVILGGTEFDHLVYIPKMRSYQLQDRIDGCPIASFTNLCDALRYML